MPIPRTKGCHEGQSARGLTLQSEVVQLRMPPISRQSSTGTSLPRTWTKAFLSTNRASSFAAIGLRDAATSCGEQWGNVWARTDSDRVLLALPAMRGSSGWPASVAMSQTSAETVSLKNATAIIIAPEDPDSGRAYSGSRGLVHSLFGRPMVTREAPKRLRVGPATGQIGSGRRGPVGTGVAERERVAVLGRIRPDRDGAGVRSAVRIGALGRLRSVRRSSSRCSCLPRAP